MKLERVLSVCGCSTFSVQVPHLVFIIRLPIWLGNDRSPQLLTLAVHPLPDAIPSAHLRLPYADQINVKLFAEGLQLLLIHFYESPSRLLFRIVGHLPLRSSWKELLCWNSRMHWRPLRVCPEERILWLGTSGAILIRQLKIMLLGCWRLAEANTERRILLESSPTIIPGDFQLHFALICRL